MLEAIDVGPFAEHLAEAKTKKVSKTDSLELIRIVLEQGKEIPPHRAPGEITVLCVEGKVIFRTADDEIELSAGTLLHLDGSNEHSLTAVEASSLLVTKVLN